MAIICGIHCLVTPFLLVALPILGSTFWTDSNFHFWMLLLVIPTTTLAVFSGYRKHKDRTVAICAVIGLSILTTATILEAVAHHSANNNADMAPAPDTADCTLETSCSTCCAVPQAGDNTSLASISLPTFTPHLLLNLTGGLFLIIGHIRNFRLCRTAKCCSGIKNLDR